MPSPVPRAPGDGVQPGLAELQPGDALSSGRFEILRRLGEGGMGVVYEAHDRARDERVALKTLRNVDAAAIYRFKNEFRALADVTHANLAALHELVADGERWFFTMELVAGVDFLRHVDAGAAAALAPTVVDGAGPADDTRDAPVDPGTAQARALDAGRLRDATRQLAEGVAALHRAGKLHRDIKPSNVLVTPEGRVVLLDFGLITEVGDQDDARRQTVFGTAAYMAPEQAAGEALSPASDWYSVGVVLYEALAGRLPFDGPLIQILIAKQRFEAPPLPPEVGRVAPDLAAIAAMLLRRAPGERPPGDAIVQALSDDAALSEPAPSGLGLAGVPFAGRRAQIAELGAAFDLARSGRTVRVHVRGRSGMGKSVLVRRFLETLGRDDATVLRGRCYEQETVPFKALDGVVDALSRDLLRLGPEELSALLPPDTAALGRMFPVLARPELSPPRAEDPSISPSPQELRSRAFAALRALLGRMSRRRPVVIWVDDLQWGDADSAALIGEILRPPDAPALLFIASYRDDAVAAGTGRGPLASLAGEEPGDGAEERAIDVGALSPEEAVELALSLLPGDGPRRLDHARAIAEEARGSPFFVDALARHLGAAGPADDRGVGPGLRLDDVVRARLSGLPDLPQRLVEVVAVAGRPVARAVALRAAGAPGPEARAAVGLLRREHLIRTLRDEGEEAFEAFHDRIREAAVAGLRPSLLASHHRALAAALEETGRPDAERLAVHYAGAGEPQKAAAHALLAAGRAVDALAFDRAATLYRLAIDLGGARPAQEASDLQTRLGEALANAGRGREAAAAFASAASGASAADALELRRRAAEQLLRGGHVEEGVAAVDEVLRAVGMRLPRTPSGALLLLLYLQARIALRGLGYRPVEARSVPEGTLTRIDLCWSISLGLSTVDTVRGMVFQKRMVLLALRTGEPFRVARALAAEIMASAVEGSRAAARTARIAARAEPLVAASDHPYPRALMKMTLGMAAYLEGRWREAADQSREATVALRSRCSGVAWELDTASLLSVWSSFLLGEGARFRREMSQLLEEAEARGDRYLHVNLRIGTLSSFWLFAGDPARARAEVDEAMSGLSGRAILVQHFNALFAHATIDLYLGEGRRALDRVRAAWAPLDAAFLFRVQGLRVQALQLRARCAVAAAEGSRDPRPLLRAAVADLRRIEREGVGWATGMARLVEAGVEASQGREDAALARLDEAIGLLDAAQMGAVAGAARWRKGKLVGGDEGRALVEGARAVMTEQAIADVDRVLDLSTPGFRR